MQGHPRGRRGHCRVLSGTAASPRSSHPRLRSRTALFLAFGVAGQEGVGWGGAEPGGGGVKRGAWLGTEGVAWASGRSGRPMP